MRKYIDSIKGLAFSATAKDTYILFVGNLGSAFWGFLFTLVVARALSISEFGIFSAVLNLMIIISSVSDFGISTGSVNFVAENYANGNFKRADQYTKASLVVRAFILIFTAAFIFIFAHPISTRLLASSDPNMARWAALIAIFIFPVMFFPNILQAKRKFLESTILDNSFYVTRILYAFWFYYFGTLTMTNSYVAFGVAFLISIILTLFYMGKGFLYAKPEKEDYANLIKFSGWIAVNRIISSVSGRLDVQMLAAMVGAVATGLYSIPSRLSSFIVVLAGSFSSVLATRLASFGNKDEERKYIVKSTLALVPVSLGILIWILFAKPFILTLFGDKYIDAVPIFQALAAAEIPFLFTVPAVTAIIYSMKKTVYIGAFSFFQIAAIFALNYYLIPKYGPFGPTVTFAITNFILVVYVWYIVIKYYWSR